MGILAVNYDLHQLSPSLNAGQINSFVPVFPNESCWADWFPDMRLFRHTPLTPNRLGQIR
jgi:hypothetical protein